MSTSRIPIEHAIVISLQPTEAKELTWRNELAKAGLGHLPIEVVVATNGNDCTAEWLAARGFATYPQWRIPGSDNRWWSRELVPGEIGCAVSHVAVWNLAKRNGWANVLVLEEDFKALGPTLTPEHFEHLPPDWDTLYLGRSPLRPDRRAIDPRLVKPGASYNAHAYVLSASGIDKLLAQGFDRCLIPVDEFLIATYVRHPRPDLTMFRCDSHTYAVRPDVLGQRSNASTSTTEHPPAPTREITDMPPTLHSYFEDKQAWVHRYLAPGVKDKQWDLLADEPITHVYCVSFFNRRFCDEVRELAEKSGTWTTKRHVNYPTTDMLLESIGLEAIYADLLKEYVIPLCVHKYGLQGRGWADMTSENFVARYTPETQGYLAIHHDAADISALVNLSEPDLDYEGGGTWFWHQRTLYRPAMGSLSVHPGNITHKHGARAVTAGKRYILVSFMNQSTRPRNPSTAKAAESGAASSVAPGGQRDQKAVLQSSESALQRSLNLAALKPSGANWLNASLELYRAGDYAGCVRAALQALKLKPEYALAYNNLCAAYNELGKWDEAIAAGVEAVRIDPHDTFAKNNLAIARRGKHGG